MASRQLNCLLARVEELIDQVLFDPDVGRKHGRRLIECTDVLAVVPLREDGAASPVLRDAVRRSGRVEKRLRVEHRRRRRRAVG
jgi:hypothetical protein